MAESSALIRGLPLPGGFSASRRWLPETSLRDANLGRDLSRMESFSVSVLLDKIRPEPGTIRRKLFLSREKSGSVKELILLCQEGK